MEDKQRVSEQNFLYPLYPYHGVLNDKTLLFNANLQEFSQKVGFISSLHTGGKLSSEEAYTRIECLWKELESTNRIIMSQEGFYPNA
ncbi:hypothetical protein [Crocosphaera sp. XPORK-15E]|uniref:DUF7219 family protein n=1 Tax=Crocosphaera sp. XPORK-15E TaxID=3110247 RepID=UPI002B2055E8|nr:hypothetical protein [Crocosphaera sp. XPORK-15E]MEA5535233.1 hypothetical protein [Crocosphaera sp. XPORK-15E]